MNAAFRNDVTKIRAFPEEEEKKKKKKKKRVGDWPGVEDHFFLKPRG